MHKRNAPIQLLGPSPPPWGGVGVFQKLLHTALVERGFAPTLHPFCSGGQAGAVFRPTARSIWAGAADLRRGEIWLDSSTFVFEYPHLPAAMSWLLLHRRRGFRWLKIVHDGTLPQRLEAFSARQRRFVQWAFRQPDAVAAVGDELADWLRAAPWFDRPVQRLASFLPLPDAYGDAAPPAEVADLASTGEALIATLGVFRPDYGFAQIAEAVARLRGEGRHARLIMVDGGFAREDDDYRRRVLQDRPWITVLTELPHEQVLKTMAACAAFVRGVQHESLGLSRLEAVRCGVPVVGTAVGVTENVSTYAFGDVDALTARLREALTHDDMRAAGQTAAMDRLAQENLQTIMQWLETFA